MAFTAFPKKFFFSYVSTSKLGQPIRCTYSTDHVKLLWKNLKQSSYLRTSKEKHPFIV